MPKIVVCLTGMPGAGKSTISKGLKSKGLETINMGDAVRAEAKKRNIEPTGENLGKLMLELRDENGPGAIAELIKNQIVNSKSDVIIIDGIRSNAEIQILREIANIKLLSVNASSERRFNFLTNRGRTDDPKNRENFDERDDRELKVGISSSIALADESISNNNLSIEQLIENANKIIHAWIK